MTTKIDSDKDSHETWSPIDTSSKKEMKMIKTNSDKDSHDTWSPIYLNYFWLSLVKNMELP